MWATLYNMFWQASAEGKLVSGLIGLLFLGGVASIIREGLRLRRERRVLEAHEKRLPPADATPGSSLTPQSFARANRAGTSLVERGLGVLWGARQQGELAMHALSSLMEDDRAERNRLAQHLATIFLLLGLAGTVLGLGGALLQLAPVMQNPNMAAENVGPVVQELARTVGQMQTVFGATLAGLVASLLLGAANAAFHACHVRLLADVERYLYQAAAPTLLRSPVDDLALASRELAQGLRAAAGISQQAQAVTQASLRTLVDVTGSWQEVSGKVTGQLIALTEHTSALTMRQQAMEGALQAVHGLLQQVEGRQARVQEMLDSAGEKLQAAAAAVHGVGAQVRTGQDKLAEALTGALGVLEQVRVRSAEAFGQIADEAHQKLEPLLQAHLEALRGTDERAERFLEAQGARVEAMVDRQQAAVGEIGKHVSAVLEKGAGAQEVLQQALLGLVDAVEEHMAEALEAAPETSAEMAARLDRAISQLEAALTRMTGAVESEATRATACIAQMGDAWRALATSVPEGTNGSADGGHGESLEASSSRRGSRGLLGWRRRPGRRPR